MSQRSRTAPRTPWPKLEITDDYDYDPEEVKALPESVKSGHLVEIKGQKQYFYCNLCQVELNSYVTMESHVVGEKHNKRAKSYESQQDISGTNVDPGQYIRLAEQVKKEKKIPVRLHAKLLEVKQPIVGLKFITEIRAISDIEAEPFYECKLCNNQGEAHGMVNHVIGRGHRERFLTQKYHKDYSAWGTAAFTEYVETDAENDLLEKSTVYTTVHSDELYPWNNGKAPWCIERGGTGHEPTYGRGSKFGRNILGSKIKDAKKATFHVKDFPEVTSPAVMDAYYEAALKIMEDVKKFHMKSAKNDRDEEDIKTYHELLNANLRIMRKIENEDNNDSGYSRGSGSSRSRSRSRSPRPTRRRSRSRSPRRRSRSPRDRRQRDYSASPSPPPRRSRYD